MIIAKYLILAVVLGVTLAEKVRYDGYRLVRIIPNNENQVDLLRKWEEEDDSFDVWNNIKGAFIGVDVALPPASFEKYSALIKANEMSFQVINDNIQRNIDDEELRMALSKLKQSEGKADDFIGKYKSHADINTWLQTTAAANSQFVTTKVIGSTIENRELRKLVIKKPTATKKLWIDCGIHAREWISPSTCIWLIYRFLNDTNTGVKEVKQILDKWEIHFLPVHNPDGYEYSRNSARLWRKNRSKVSTSTCVGTDLNRNYPDHWMQGGASNSPCSDTFAGPSAASELETKAVVNEISQYNDWSAFVTIHSYGQWFLTPYGWTQNRPTDYNDLLDLAVKTSNAFKSYQGFSYVSGSTSNLLYIASGNSADWAYGTKGIKYSYTIELRPGSGTPDSSYGFQLPEDRAPHVGEEIYTGMKTFINSL